MAQILLHGYLMDILFGLPWTELFIFLKQKVNSLTKMQLLQLKTNKETLPQTPNKLKKI